jgi:hypothetical protein
MTVAIFVVGEAIVGAIKLGIIVAGGLKAIDKLEEADLDA